jgi:Ca2+-transporting ATPase
MSTLHLVEGEPMMLVKGAPDVLLSKAEFVLTPCGVVRMTPGWKQRIQKRNHAWSAQGMRVLAMAYRNPSLSAENLASGHLELSDVNHLTWIGMAAMIDPPRPETHAAVLSAQRAGIRTVMITGDHKITAASIARQIGIFRDGDEAVTGMELDKMTDDQLQNCLDRISVCARVSPEHKIRIVEAWQKRGKIVAMTGDGVNDAPALKKADIGIAMGRSGTEVSRDASSMILTDDNFATIIKAVSNGRNVYRNICHAIEFLLSGNMAGIFCVL